MFRRGLRTPVADGGADVAAAVGDAGGPEAGNYVNWAPWVEPPIGSIPLFLSGSANTVGAADVQTPIAATATRKNYMRVIRGFSLLAENMLTTTSLNWVLLVNGIPVDGLNPVTILPRVVTSIERVLSVLVFVPSLVTVAVQVTNVDGGAYIVGANLEGWDYPLKKR